MQQYSINLVDPGPEGRPRETGLTSISVHCTPGGVVFVSVFASGLDLYQFAS